MSTGATLICYPDWMPKPQRAGYSYEPTDRTISSEMEIGTIRRVEFDTDETVISCTLLLKNCLERSFFEAFERDCLRQGCKWFMMPVEIAGEVEQYKARFRERPKLTQIIGKSAAKYSIVLEIDRRDLMDPMLVHVLLLFGPTGFSSVAKGVCSLVTQTLPGVTNIPDDLNL